MNKLSQEGTVFKISHRKEFVGTEIKEEQLFLAIDFAYEMVYGKGHHRSTRSGGTLDRKKGEKFCNTFQGKLAEIVLHDLLEEQDIEVSELDFSINGEGIWDESDLTANGRKINIKSAASFSNLLLLEQRDWDRDGCYIPDLQQGRETLYDAFVLVRFQPDIKSIFRKKSLFYSNEYLSLCEIKNIILETLWYYDFAGYINIHTFRYLISNNFILPKDTWLNGSVKMDASNYYCQAGNMPSLEMFIEKLKIKK